MQQRKMTSISTVKPTDSAVNAQVSRILQSNSDIAVSVDASLAPYITTCLRSRRFELQPSYTGENSEHDSKYSFSPECRDMIELIMDNCLMDQERAETTMYFILDAVRGGGFVSCLSSRLSNLKCSDLPAEDCATSNSTSSTSSCSETIEELVQSEDTLIPTDLLDDLEEEEEEDEQELAESSTELQFVCEDSNENGKLCNENKVEEKEPTAQDLVEALFSDSSTRRSRSESLASENQCTASKQTAVSYNSQVNYNQFQLEQTCQLLLSFNSDLSYEAAQSAALLAGGDVNLAQHALEQVRFVLEFYYFVPTFCTWCSHTAIVDICS